MADAVDFLKSAQAAAYPQIDIRTLGAWRSQGSGPCFYRVALNTAAPISISVCNSTVSRLPATASGGSDRSRLGAAPGGPWAGADPLVPSPPHRQLRRGRAVSDGVAHERGYRSAAKKTELERLGFETRATTGHVADHSDLVPCAVRSDRTSCRPTE